MSLPHTPSPNAVNEIVQRVKAAAMATKSAADSGGVSDPNDRGTAKAPMYPPIDGLPPNKPLTTGVPSDDQTLNPGPTGTAVPAAESQNAKDNAATSPTTPLDKIAGDVQSRLTNVLAVINGKSASAAVTPPENTPPAVNAPKSAAIGDPAFTQEVLAKLASLALKTEEGQSYMAQLVERELGQEKAASMIQEAVAAHYAFGKSASAQEAQQYEAWVETQKQAALLSQQQAAAEQEFAAIMQNASADDVAAITHFAKMSAWADTNFDHPLLKAAFEQGMDDAAGDVAAEEAGQELPTGEEAPAPEEIAQLIQAAVESGQLPPEVAMQLMDALAQPGAADGGTGQEMDEEMVAAASFVS